MYPIQSVPSESTSSNASAANVCTDATAMITSLRLWRSATGPAIGVIRNAGNACATSTSVTRIDASLTSCTTPTNATYANQSPMYETTRATNSHRRSRLVRSSIHMPPPS